MSPAMKAIVAFSVGFVLLVSSFPDGVMRIEKWSELPPRVRRMRDVLLSQLKDRFRMENAPELWLMAAMCSPFDKHLRFLTAEMQAKGARIFRDFIASTTAAAVSVPPASTSASASVPPVPSGRRLTSRQVNLERFVFISYRTVAVFKLTTKWSAGCNCS
jgi:hypothetical protein